jgi:hypothetical protein
LLDAWNYRLSSVAAQDDLVAAAKEEWQLFLYLSTNLTDAHGMIRLFKQKYPFINVNFFRADNEKLLNRIILARQSRNQKMRSDLATESTKIAKKWRAGFPTRLG